MTDDIVERMRDADAMTKAQHVNLLGEASYEIEMLRAQNVELMRLYYQSEDMP